MLEKPNERIRMLKLQIPAHKIEKLFNIEQGNNVLMGYHGKIGVFK